jgi:DNA-binding beta-propeller fold protein YncE
VAAAGCGIGQSGISPPLDHVFFPAGIAMDPTGQWLYVVNSNSDLRYNAGTVVAVDLAGAAVDRAKAASFPLCPRNRYVPGPNEPARLCCRDLIDDKILNCSDRGYVDAEATVEIGSFGGQVVLQPYMRGGAMVRRLFVAVRAEPSLTFIDVTIRDGRVTFRCSGGRDDQGKPAPGTPCTDDWRIKTGQGTGGTGLSNTAGDPGTGAAGSANPVGEIAFQEEPHSLALDQALGILYVGHLSGVERNTIVVRGASVVDVCAPERTDPKLVSILRNAMPRSLALGVNALAVPTPGRPEMPIFAAGEDTAEIGELRLREPGAGVCDPAAAGSGRELTLVPGRRFLSSAFGTRSAKLTGLLFSRDGSRAYVLHRQSTSRNGELNPPALAVVDRTLDARGEPKNTPIGVVDVCYGPTRLAAHDAGRGERLFVNCFEGGQIYVIDPGLMAVEAVVEVGAGPAELVFSPGDRTVAFVAGFADNNLSVLDLAPGSVTEYRVVQRIGFPRNSAVAQ